MSDLWKNFHNDWVKVFLDATICSGLTRTLIYIRDIRARQGLVQTQTKVSAGKTQWTRVIHHESPSEHWVTVCVNILSPFLSAFIQ